MPYIEYSSQADPFDKRRLGRSRFAAYCLPEALLALAFSWFAGWFIDALAQVEVGSTSPHLGKGGIAFGFFAYGLVYYQYRQLLKRCNDAGQGWPAARLFYRIAVVLAVASAFVPLLMPVFLLVAVLLFVYGMVLPSNQEPNLSGHPNPPASLWELVCAVAAAVVYLWVFLWLWKMW